MTRGDYHEDNPFMTTSNAVAAYFVVIASGRTIEEFAGVPTFAEAHATAAAWHERHGVDAIVVELVGASRVLVAQFYAPGRPSPALALYLVSRVAPPAPLTLADKADALRRCTCSTAVTVRDGAAVATSTATCGASGGVGVTCDRPAGHGGPHGDRHETWPRSFAAALAAAAEPCWCGCGRVKG